MLATSKYVLNLPERFKMQAGRLKPLLIDALLTPLPRAISNARKRGFTLPIKLWLNHQVAESFQEYVLNKDNEAFWDLSIVSDLWSGYQKGRVGWGTVWNLYSFSRWVKDHGESL